jgi:hypothetical protein
LQQLLVIREGSYVMEEVLRELTEFELDAVAGGDPFAITQNNVVGTNLASNSDFAIGAVAAEAVVITQLANVGINV